VVAKLVAIVLPLGLDTFAVAAAIGATGISQTNRVRIPLLFSAFETGMPLVGLALGAPIGRVVGGAADYVAIGVLFAFGVYTLLRREDEQALTGWLDRRGASLLILGLSISVDELAIGFSLGLLRLPVLLTLGLIGAQTVIVTQLGLRLGSRLSEHLREGAELLAGAALTVLALVLLAEKLLA
jgi:putative Mn2+ efflux pump MntP